MLKLTALSPEEVEAIHQATLRVLSETGILLSQPDGREILTSAGAKAQDERVILPPDLVEKAVSQCPRQVTIRGRGGRYRSARRWPVTLA